jgi:hypothetical protein
MGTVSRQESVPDIVVQAYLFMQDSPVHCMCRGLAVEWSCISRTPGDRDLKMSCIDASRRQLQSARQIRV